MKYCISLTCPVHTFCCWHSNLSLDSILTVLDMPNHDDQFQHWPVMTTITRRLTSHNDQRMTDKTNLYHLDDKNFYISGPSLQEPTLISCKAYQTEDHVDCRLPTCSRCQIWVCVCRLISIPLCERDWNFSVLWLAGWIELVSLLVQTLDCLNRILFDTWTTYSQTCISYHLYRKATCL